MTTQLQKLWQFLNTDISQLCRPTGAVEVGTEVSKTALEFAIALGLIGSPLAPAGIAMAGVSVVGIAAKGIRFYREKTGKEPIIEECVAIAVPLAYLESFDELFRNNDRLKQIKSIPVSESVKQRIKELGELKLDEDLAKNAINCFYKSELA